MFLFEKLLGRDREEAMKMLRKSRNEFRIAPENVFERMNNGIDSLSQFGIILPEWFIRSFAMEVLH